MRTTTTARLHIDKKSAHNVTYVTDRQPPLHIFATISLGVGYDMHGILGEDRRASGNGSAVY
jgi:hypothetical protein